MTRVLTVKEYKKATVWQRAEEWEKVHHARAESRKRKQAREAELRVLDAEFELAHERLLLVEEQRRIIAPYIPTEAEAIRRLALFRYAEPESVGEQRLLEATAEAFA